MRLGFLSRDIIGNCDGKKYIWVHAVSVGETMVASRLISVLRSEFPVDNLLISTVTPTGNRIAHSIARDADQVIYLPLDFGWVVKRIIRHIKPIMFITTETEIWPNLISVLHKHSIPIALINGRISDKSFKGYARAKFFLKHILAKIQLFCMQTQKDAERIVELGADEGKIKVTGNMKFDDVPETAKHHSLSNLNIEKEGQLLFVAGSTHPGEEEIIVDSYKILKKEFP
ncbi:3-deoxy-D-manno-octulosonic acid transferase, partial [Candidatus Omnitrophota bacterium]